MPAPKPISFEALTELFDAGALSNPVIYRDLQGWMFRCDRSDSKTQVTIKMVREDRARTYQRLMTAIADGRRLGFRDFSILTPEDKDLFK